MENKPILYCIKGSTGSKRKQEIKKFWEKNIYPASGFNFSNNNFYYYRVHNVSNMRTKDVILSEYGSEFNLVFIETEDSLTNFVPKTSTFYPIH